MQGVKVDAARGNRSLTGGQPDGAASLRKRRVVAANPVLLFFRRFIDSTVAEAKKIRYGRSTPTAILARWWISDLRPARGDRSALGRRLYGASFECCCEMLGLEVDAERKRALAEVDDAVVKQIVAYVGDVTYEERARVLTCSGLPTSIGRQYVLGLVDAGDYEDVADPDQAKRVSIAVKREQRAAARVAAKRAKRLKAG